MFLIIVSANRRQTPEYPPVWLGRNLWTMDEEIHQNPNSTDKNNKTQQPCISNNFMHRLLVAGTAEQGKMKAFSTVEIMADH